MQLDLIITQGCNTYRFSGKDLPQRYKTIYQRKLAVIAGLINHQIFLGPQIPPRAVLEPQSHMP